MENTIKIREQPDKYLATILLSAAAQSGNEGAIRLAAQLANAQPCPKCQFIWTHCRCIKGGFLKNGNQML